MSQPLVLAIEPDLRQAAIVKRIVREKALAEVAVVDSRDAAIEAMRTCMPDVLLLSALMSPRDEDELIAHLKTLENAAHLQTHTIPQLASSLGSDEEPAARGLLSAFRRKKGPAPLAAGCDPDMFAEEIRMYLQRAADKKRQLQNTDFTAPDMRPSANPKKNAASQPAAEAADAGPSSSWSSPFEWKPSGSSRHAAPIHSHAELPPVEGAHAPHTSEPEAAAAPQLPPPAPVAAAAPIAAAAPDAPVIVAAPLAAEVAPPAPAVAAVTAPVAAVEVVKEPDLPPARRSEPVVHAVAEPPVPERPVAAVPTAAKAPAAEPVRLKPVADRPARTAARVPFQGLVKAEAQRERERRDRLGPLARWARSESPRAAKGAPVTSDDVRALISSLAVPSAVASVTYPSGCRIRRVRVPLSADAEGAENAAAAMMARRPSSDLRKQPSA